MDRKEIDDKIVDVIKKVSKLGWIRRKSGEPLMHLADVEKTIIALFDESEMERIDEWIKDMKTVT